MTELWRFNDIEAEEAMEEGARRSAISFLLSASEQLPALVVSHLRGYIMAVARPTRYLTKVDRKLDCELAISIRYGELAGKGYLFASQKVVGEALEAGWSIWDIQTALDDLGLGKRPTDPG